VGIHKGPVAKGSLGGLSRCQLTMLGHTVNVAARIEGLTKQLPSPVAITESLIGGPLPNFWNQPEQVNFSLREVGRHHMKNIKEPILLFGLGPLIQTWVDFVPMGYVASPEKGIVYLDTGGSLQPGIIDLQESVEDNGSACELLLRQPELLLDHIRGVPHAQIEFRLHTQPDLAGAASLYVAYELMVRKPRKALLKGLAKYVSLINQGYIPNPGTLNDSLYGIYMAHHELLGQRSGVSDLQMLEAGMRVIDSALLLAQHFKKPRDFDAIFQATPNWYPHERALLFKDKLRFQKDQYNGHTYAALVGGYPHPVQGLWLDHPTSVLFKYWARAATGTSGGRAYTFMVVDWSAKGKNRYVLSVDPDSGYHFQGLGAVLEKAEKQKRKTLKKERPKLSKHQLADNADPWYFGQRHDYTVIDAPNAGTVLTARDFQILHEKWTPE